MLKQMRRSTTAKQIDAFVFATARARRPARARKLYTSARIYEWKLGKGEWKFPIARPTGRVDFLGCSELLFFFFFFFVKNARTK